jgi:hypothetical protein
MGEVSYRHTARVKADSWFLRFYCWLWEADPQEADFCRLFWGYLLAIPNLLVRVIGYVPYKVTKRVGAWFSALKAKVHTNSPTWEQEEKWRDERVLSRKLRKQRRRRKYAGLLSFASRTADRVVAIAQTVWPVLRWPTFAAVGAIGLAVIGAFLYLVYMVGTVAVGNIEIIGLVTLFLIAAVVSGVSLATLFLLSRWFFKDTSAGSTIRTGTKGGFLTFGGALRTGLLAIKTRTCPKIEVVDADPK